MAFGRMDMKPSDFYEMEMEDFVLKVEGFTDQNDWLEACIRRLAAIVQSGIPYKGTPPKMERLWPMRKDKENKRRATDRTNRKNLNTAAWWENTIKTIDSYNKRLKQDGSSST